MELNVTETELTKQPTVLEFAYVGAIQSWQIRTTGTYKLEVWGAQGGYQGNNYSTLYYGAGYGGYSVGNTTLSQGEDIYVAVGGQGTYSVNNYDSNTQGYKTGGYNGGGNTQNNYGAGGGGATHIATRTGLLSTLSSYKSDILIVAGGGGGGNYQCYINSAYWNYIGHGGGYIGNEGFSTYYNTYYYPTGGTQSAGGTVANLTYAPWPGSFGQGGTGYSSWAGGGGGGFYGGAGGYSYRRNNSSTGRYTYYYGTGAGGSGYLNSMLTDKCMYTYSATKTSSAEATKTMSTSNVSATATANYAKQGNGYARITLIE